MKWFDRCRLGKTTKRCLEFLNRGTGTVRKIINPEMVCQIFSYQRYFIFSLKIPARPQRYKFDLEDLNMTENWQTLIRRWLLLFVTLSALFILRMPVWCISHHLNQVSSCKLSTTPGAAIVSDTNWYSENRAALWHCHFDVLRRPMKCQPVNSADETPGTVKYPERWFFNQASEITL